MPRQRLQSVTRFKDQFRNAPDIDAADMGPTVSNTPIQPLPIVSQLSAEDRERADEKSWAVGRIICGTRDMSGSGAGEAREHPPAKGDEFLAFAELKAFPRPSGHRG
jgi:hypothetical protein